MTKVVNKLHDFMKLESSAGIFLMLAAALALIANNSFLSQYYSTLLDTPFEIRLGGLDRSGICQG